MKKNGFAPLMIILVIAILGIVLFLGAKSGRDKMLNENKSPNSLSSVQSTSLKTYTDKTMDISLKYPDFWTIATTSSAGYSILISSPETSENNPGNGGASLSIEAITCGKVICQTIKDHPGFNSIQFFDNEKMSNFGTIQIGGTKALVFNYTKVLDNSLTNKPNEVTAQRVYLFDHNNMTFEAIYEEVDKDINPVSDFSKWKYTDIRDQIINSISY